MAYIFVLSFPVIVCEEVLIDYSIDIGVSQGFDGRPGKARFVSLSVKGERTEEFLRLVEGFLDGEGPFDPIDCGFDFF